jgi:mannose-6-phosphate isomerase-like protein (cupin superfamily)
MTGRIGRRVVTGLDSEGRSCILSDGPADVIFRFPDQPVPQGNWSEVHWMWTHNGTPTVPNGGSGSGRAPANWFPGPGGSRLIIETLGPRFGVDPAPAEEYESGSNSLQDIGTVFNSRYQDRTGVHSSDTIDYAIVISGRLWLEMTDGAEIVLEQGDCVVQTGVRHSWRNRDEEPCQVAFIMIGAERTVDPESDGDGVSGVNAT